MPRSMFVLQGLAALLWHLRGVGESEAAAQQEDHSPAHLRLWEEEGLSSQVSWATYRVSQRKR